MTYNICVFQGCMQQLCSLIDVMYTKYRCICSYTRSECAALENVVGPIMNKTTQAMCSRGRENLCIERKVDFYILTDSDLYGWTVQVYYVSKQMRLSISCCSVAT